MDDKSKETYKLKKQLRELAHHSGGSTEMISVYIPPGYPIYETSNKLKTELGQASNIKSKGTRKNVTDSLAKIINYLKMFRETPKNGIAIFCGNISSNPAKTDIELFSMSPPEPLNIQIYRCDSAFFLDPIRDLVEVKDTYGIVVLDGREATIATVKGKSIIILKRLNSMAHAKIRKGGQCLAPDTLIQLASGELSHISEAHAGSLIKAANLQDFTSTDSLCSDKFTTKAKNAYKIVVHAPRMEIEATAWHRFFTITENGVKETFAKDLKRGDRMLIARKLNHSGAEVKTEFKPSYRMVLGENEFLKLQGRRKELKWPQSLVAKKLGITQMAVCRMERGEIPLSAGKIRELYKLYGLFLDEKSFRVPSVSLPECYTANLSYLLGVIAGDGTLDGNRIIIYESYSELAEKYARIAKETLGLEAVLRKVDKTGQKGSFAKKEYYEIRLYSKDFAEFVNSEISQTISSSDIRCVPLQIQKSPLNVQASFLSGLYDAEGYIHGKRVEIAMRSREMMRQLQAMLLRFGICASYGEKAVKGNPQWFVSISDLQSLKNFETSIGFSREDKKNALRRIASRRMKMQFVDQVPVDGREVFKFVKTLGLKTSDFHAASDFFRNKKPLGREAFIKNIRGVLLQRAERLGQKKLAEKMLAKWLPEHIGVAKVSEKIPICTERKYFDLTVPNTFNFVANGFIVHNSARRFERLIEESIEKYYKRIGEAMDTYFLTGIKGVVVGGPGPAKEFFMQAKPFNYQIKVLGVVDTGYTDEYGVRETLTKSSELIQGQELLEEKKIIDSFLKEVAHGGLAIYGEKDVREAMERKAIKTLMVSEGLHYVRAKLMNSAGEEKWVNARDEEELAEKAEAEKGFKIMEKKALLDDLVDLAEDKGIEVKIISNETEEGAQFLQSFYGIGAFLHYRK